MVGVLRMRTNKNDSLSQTSGNDLEEHSATIAVITHSGGPARGSLIISIIEPHYAVACRIPGFHRVVTSFNYDPDFL